MGMRSFAHSAQRGAGNRPLRMHVEKQRGGKLHAVPCSDAMAQMHLSEQSMIDLAEAENEDNGFADLAETDVVEEEESTPELTFEEKLSILTDTVIKHPLNREILYKILAFCQEEKPLRVVEEQVALYPEFGLATQNQYHMVTTLVKAHGLRLVERDINGAEVLPEQKEGLSEDEIDDLVYSLNYITTEVGDRFVEIHRPAARLVELLQLDPTRSETYIDVLRYVSEESRSYADIQNFLKGRPALETVIDGNHVTMQPSVFVDKLERNGALVWDKGWRLTEEGKVFLEEMIANAQAK